MSRWFHEGREAGGVRAAAHSHTHTASSAAAEVERLHSIVGRIGKLTNQLNEAIEAFQNEGGFDHITDSDGQPYTSMSKFLTDKLDLSDKFLPFLIDD